MIYRDRRLMPLVFLFLLISCGGGGDGAVTPPIAPTGLNAVPGESIITLSWEDNSDNESSFVIYREEFADTELNQLALSKYQEVPADTTSYVDNVDPNKLYSYRVTAKNSQGETPDDASQNVVDKVQANPSAGNYRLRILRSGDGGGVTVSSPAGIDCDHGSGGDCSEVYKEGTVVSLTATPDSTSQVVWDGICEGSTNSCSVTIDKSLADDKGDIDVNVTMQFSGVSFEVTKSGTGRGIVTSSPEGINCGNDCEENFSVSPIEVVFRASPRGSSLFTGWQNCPAVEGTDGDRCRVKQNDPGKVTIGAEFMLPPPVINSFSATPEKVDVNADVTLAWNVSGEGTISLSLLASVEGGAEPAIIDVSTKEPVDSIVVKPTQSTTYTLVATTESGSSEPGEATVAVGDKASITKFEVDDDTVLAGTEIELSWEVTGETPITLTLNDGVSDTDVTGTSSIKLSPTETTTYTLTAINDFDPAGDVSEPVTVTIGTAPVISSFSADDDTVTAGSTVELSWSVTDATSLELTGGASPVDVTGTTSIEVTPGATTTYTLIATNDFASTSLTEVVNVGTATSITSFKVDDGDTSVVAGTSITFTWTTTGTDPKQFVIKRDSGSDIAVTGSDHTLTVTETTTYTLVAGNDYGLDDTSDPVTITVGEVPVVDTVTADYAAAPPPPEVTIAWTVTPNSVTDPTLELTRRPSTGGAAVPVAITGTDSTTDTPAAGTYIYSLIATNEFGSSTAEDATAVVVP